LLSQISATMKPNDTLATGAICVFGAVHSVLTEVSLYCAAYTARIFASYNTFRRNAVPLIGPRESVILEQVVISSREPILPQVVTDYHLELILAKNLSRR
jgi:hypothetical protein